MDVFTRHNPQVAGFPALCCAAFCFSSLSTARPFLFRDCASTYGKSVSLEERYAPLNSQVLVTIATTGVAALSSELNTSVIRRNWFRLRRSAKVSVYSGALENHEMGEIETELFSIGVPGLTPLPLPSQNGMEEKEKRLRSPHIANRIRYPAVDILVIRLL